MSGGYKIIRNYIRKKIDAAAAEKIGSTGQAGGTKPEGPPHFVSLLYNTSQRENPMTELNKLVTADAVKAALRSEEVRGKLKETIRKTFEAQIDADVEAILDELIGPAEVQPGAPTGRGCAGG